MYKNSVWPGVIFILFAFGPGLAGQTARIVAAAPLRLPGVADSNSPSHWSEGKLILFNSDGMPIRSEGENLESLGRVRAARFYSYEHAPLWIEATYKSPKGTLYAWYHHEVFLHCEENPVSAPVIGALRSFDDGKTFEDLGIILQAGEEPDCGTRNRYFGGGNGDFSAIVDREGEYLYLAYSSYSGPASSQGVAMARIRVEALDEPVGQVFKYFNGTWEEPGLGGAVSPVFAASASWASEAADAMWGPSIHWNTYLKKFVMVMNHTCCGTDWPQEGIYVTYSGDLARPETWMPPQKLMDGGGWYPMVVGTEAGGTDKLAGQTARFFMGSDSDWLIEFSPN
jgi:hypothetical protein